MITLKTKVNPTQFEPQLGKLQNIYTTTISSFSYVVFIYSVLVLIIGITKFVQLVDTFTTEFFLWLTIPISIIFICIYILLAIPYCYVAIYSTGILIKKRYKTIVVKNSEIKNIELRNLSILYNYIRKDNSKRLAIDITLHNNNIISMGESNRIFNLIAYPRIPSSTKIWDIKKLYKEIGGRL